MASSSFNYTQLITALFSLGLIIIETKSWPSSTSCFPPPFLQAAIDTKVRMSDDADDLIDAEKLGLENHVLHALHIEYHPQ